MGDAPETRMGMRVLRAIIVLGICVAVLGFFRGWFTLSSSGPDAVTNKVDVNLSVDPDKVKEDVGRVSDKASDLGNQATDEFKSDSTDEQTMQRIDEANRTVYSRA